MAALLRRAAAFMSKLEVASAFLEWVAVRADAVREKEEQQHGAERAAHEAREAALLRDLELERRAGARRQQERQR